MRTFAPLVLGAALSAAVALAAGPPDDRPADAPGPEHEALRPFEGRWDAEIRRCAPHGGSERSRGVETAAFRLGGFWLLSEFESTTEGRTFEGLGMLGYDPARRRYVMTWCSSSSGGLVLLEGGWDAAGRALTMTAAGAGPDGRPRELRAVHRVVDPDHTEFRLSVAETGEEGKACPCLTIRYARRR